MREKERVTYSKNKNLPLKENNFLVFQEIKYFPYFPENYDHVTKVGNYFP